MGRRCCVAVTNTSLLLVCTATFVCFGIQFASIIQHYCKHYKGSKAIIAKLDEGMSCCPLFIVSILRPGAICWSWKPTMWVGISTETSLFLSLRVLGADL